MKKKMNKKSRVKELCERYLGKPSSNLSDLVIAEKIASGYAWTLDESQPVSDEQLNADIDEMREMLIKGRKIYNLPGGWFTRFA